LTTARRGGTLRLAGRSPPSRCRRTSARRCPVVLVVLGRVDPPWGHRVGRRRCPGSRKHLSCSRARPSSAPAPRRGLPTTISCTCACWRVDELSRAVFATSGYGPGRDVGLQSWSSLQVNEAERTARGIGCCEHHDPGQDEATVGPRRFHRGCQAGSAACSRSRVHVHRGPIGEVEPEANGFGSHHDVRRPPLTNSGARAQREVGSGRG